MQLMPKLKAVRRRGPGRPPQHKTEDLRDLYLRAALETFLENGYERASLEEIARRAKAGKMTLYRLYGSKEELFRRVVTSVFARASATLHIDLREYRTAKDALQGLVRHLFDALTEPTWLGVQRLAIAEGMRFPELARELRSHDRELMGPVEEFLRQADVQGLLAIGDARAAAYQLAALASGGVRFLIHQPLTSEAGKRGWVAAIVEFAWNSWAPDNVHNVRSRR